eukprot:2949789-Alexandrium_andersonii.AAC.1
MLAGCSGQGKLVSWPQTQAAEAAATAHAVGTTALSAARNRRMMGPPGYRSGCQRRRARWGGSELR